MIERTSFTWIKRGLRRPDFWVGLGLYYAVWYFGYARSDAVFNLWLSIGGATAVALAAALDTYSTWLAIHLRPEFERRGEEFPLVEISPFLSEQPTLRDLLTWKRFAIVAAECLLGFVLPPFGFAQALSHTLQAIRNFRLGGWLSEELRLDRMGLKVGEPSNA